MAGRIDAEYQQLKDRTHRWVVERLDEEGIEVGNAGSDQLSDFVRTTVGQYIALNRVPLSTQDLNQLARDGGIGRSFKHDGNQIHVRREVFRMNRNSFRQILGIEDDVTAKV